jgi:hypothetical protein
VNVLVVVEDPALDEHIARPVVEALMADAGIRGKVRVLSNPRLRGANDALDRDILGGIGNVFGNVFGRPQRPTGNKGPAG